MNINWNKEDTTKSVYTTLVIFVCIIFAKIVFKLDSFTLQINNIIQILQPFIIGSIIAYLVNFILNFYKRNLLKITKTNDGKKYHSIAVALSYITILLIIYMFLSFVLPQLIISLKGLVNDIPNHIDNTSIFFNQLLNELNISPEIYTILNDKWNAFIKDIIQWATTLIPFIGQFLKTTASSVLNVFLGFIISIYILLDKEQFKGLSIKVLCAFCSKERAKRILEITRRSHNIFGKFICGKILDSTIISILTFLILVIFNMPYALLIACMMGSTNFIPVVGPFIGAIPSTIIVLFVSPVKAFWFIVLTLIIQQLDSNIIEPKILGNSIGMSAFWVLFALLVFGGIWGLPGMVIGVPSFAVIYSILKEIVEARLEKKGLPIETDLYIKKNN